MIEEEFGHFLDPQKVKPKNTDIRQFRIVFHWKNRCIKIRRSYRISKLSYFTSVFKFHFMGPPAKLAPGRNESIQIRNREWILSLDETYY